LSECGIEQGDCDYYGLGYVANLNGKKNTIITAAHNLWDHPDDATTSRPKTAEKAELLGTAVWSILYVV
jgi:hypothetical protein